MGNTESNAQSDTRSDAQKIRDELCNAASKGDNEKVLKLIQLGADINDASSSRTPLTAAASEGKTASIALLLDHKAKINLTDGFSETPLTVAASEGQTATIALLLDRGAEINITGADGLTPLMNAARGGHYSAAELLITRGADKSSTDIFGKSAKDRALKIPDFIFVDLLTEDRLYTAWVKPLFSSMIVNEKDVRANKGFITYISGRLGQKKLGQDLQEVCAFIYRMEGFDKGLVLNWSNMGIEDADLEKKLKELNILNGDIQYQILLIDNNHLTVLPDLSKYPPLQGLQILVAFNNKIRAMRGFPPDLNAIFLMKNDIEVLERKCFHETIFDHLTKQLNETSIARNLKKPPQEVLNLGLQAVLDYFTQGDFLLNYHNRMVVIGPSMDGKSSLMKSLIAGKPMLTKDAERTQVVDIKKWEISETEVIYIYDQGGHDIYQITNPYFISPRSIVLISHKAEPDISCKNSSDNFNHKINKTLQFMRTTQHQHPENEIYIVVTKTDQLTQSVDPNNAEAKSYCLKVKTAVNEALQLEIDNLNKILHSASYSKNVQSMIKHTQDRLSQIKVFPVSSSTYAGIDDFQKELHQKIQKERTEIPKAWIDTYNVMKADKKGFWLKRQFQNCFQQHIKGEDQNSQTCLRYLHETGLVLWNERHHKLSEYVFYDMEFLVDIFKSLFDHSLSLESFECDEVQKAFGDEGKFKEILNCYQKEGLLKHSLLSFLLRSYGLSKENEETIVEIIKLFNFCSETELNCKDLEEQLYFVPWLVRENQPPSDVHINQPLIINQETITLVMRYQFFNAMPLNIAERFFVEIQKYSMQNKNYLGRRYAWHDGLQVFLGQAQIILFRMVEDSSIYLCTRGNPAHLPTLWKPFRELNNTFEKVLKPWRGLVRSRHSICAHCVLHGINPPHQWMPEQVFPDTPYEAEARCPKGGDVIPAALITCLTQDAADATEQVESVKTYLEKYCPEEKQSVALTGRPQGLHATSQNSKLTPQQSEFVLDQILPFICRINIPGFNGTGFVIGASQDPGTRLTHSYVLTCYHIKLFPALRDQQHCDAQFDSRNAAAAPIIVKILQPLYWSQDLDFVLVKLEASQALDNSLAGKVPLGQMVTVNSPKHNDALVLCAHTARPQIDWGARALSIDDEAFQQKHGDLDQINRKRQGTYGTIYPLSRKFTLYQCSCQEGSSGAPCFSVSQTRLFSMHCGSVYKSTLENSPEYGVLLKDVVHDIETKITNPSSISSTSYDRMQQGGLQLHDLESLFGNLPKGMDPTNDQESDMLQ